MARDRYYLRQDVQAEPLVDQWYAWTHLISPATAARNVTHRHLRIIESFLSAPEVHANAVKNPAMLGGPFIDHGKDRLAELRELRDRTKRDRAALLELSSALEQLDRMLESVADGRSLHDRYVDVPTALQGYVELLYDARNRASFRLIEPLLYRSRFYDASMQSLLLSITRGDSRSFVLSTPRLPSPGSVHLPWHFDDPRVDELFRLKREPREWSWIKDRLGVRPEDEAAFRAFLTTAAPAANEPYRGNGLRCRYFGHACVLLESTHCNVLLDPSISYGYPSDIERYTYADLPERIDFVLITHNHMDHVLIETLLQIRHKVVQIVVPRSGSGALQDPSLRLALQSMGFRNVIELGELDEIPLGAPGMTVVGVPFLGEHSDLPVATKLGYVVRLGRSQLAFVADSCVMEPRLYEHVHDILGDVDMLFIGMECVGAPMSWLYGPLLLRPVERGVDESRRLNGSDCAQVRALVEQLRCKEVYVYAMGQEPWLNHIMSLRYTENSRAIVESNALIDACKNAGVKAERLFARREIVLDGVFAGDATAGVVGF